MHSGCDSQHPLVTVVTVCFNLIEQGRRDSFLQCARSVRLQTYPNIEHIIIDGGSHDGTVELIQSLGLDYISELDRGIYDAMNKGIQRAKGKYIVFLNSDDYFHNLEGIARSVHGLLRSGAAFSYARSTIMWNEEENTRSTWKSRYHRTLWRMPFCHQSMLCDREILVKEGMFDTAFKSAADYDLIVRLFLKGYKAVCVPCSFATFKMGGMSTQQKEISQEEMVAVFEKNYASYLVRSRDEWRRFLEYPILPFSLYGFYSPLGRCRLAINAFLIFIKCLRRKVVQIHLRKKEELLRLCGLDEISKSNEYLRDRIPLDVPVRDNKVVVVVPVYKNVLSHNELASLMQCKKILGKHPIWLVAPKHINVEYYRNVMQGCDVHFLLFANHHFKNVDCYSQLLLNPIFYRHFDLYVYMLIYQLDAWVFKDDLEMWCARGFDYIGAPWFQGFDKATIDSPMLPYAGNGGLSLRNIQSCLLVLSYKPRTSLRKIMEERPKRRRVSTILSMPLCVYYYFRSYFYANYWLSIDKNEDFVFVEHVPKVMRSFKLARSEEAMFFSFEMNPRKLYSMTNSVLPFGCHAFEKYDFAFWKNFIHID